MVVYGGSPSHIIPAVDENPSHQDQRALLSQLGRTDVIVDLARWAAVVNGFDEGFGGVACMICSIHTFSWDRWDSICLA